jgi:hypothetical protein
VSVPEDERNNPKPTGQVRHDASGRAVWEWAADTGRHALDSTSRLLKRLDLPGLTLADDDKKKQAADEKNLADLKAAAGKHSFNPYDNRAPARKIASKPVQKHTPKASQPVKKPGLLARWFGGR